MTKITSNFELEEQDWSYGSALATATLWLVVAMLHYLHDGETWFVQVVLLSGLPLIITVITLSAALKLHKVWHWKGELQLKILSASAIVSSLATALVISKLLLNYPVPMFLNQLVLPALMLYPSTGIALGLWWFFIQRTKVISRADQSSNSPGTREDTASAIDTS